MSLRSASVFSLAIARFTSATADVSVLAAEMTHPDSSMIVVPAVHCCPRSVPVRAGPVAASDEHAVGAGGGHGDDHFRRTLAAGPGNQRPVGGIRDEISTA